jgi:hypothetical protein
MRRRAIGTTGSIPCRCCDTPLARHSLKKGTGVLAGEILGAVKGEKRDSRELEMDDRMNELQKPLRPSSDSDRSHLSL